jgi:hypothetical protein
MDFEGMTLQFMDLVEGLAGGREVGIDTIQGKRVLSISDKNRGEVMRVYMFHYPNGEQGDDLSFLYGLKTDNDVEVLPVALPGDAMAALSLIRRRFG